MDECVTGNNFCSSDATCTDHEIGYTCECNAGFIGDGFICNDVNECDSSPCGPNGHCINSHGGFNCHCNQGN